MSKAPGKPSLKERLKIRRQRHRKRSKLYRFLYSTLAVLITLVGLIMIVTPGPAIIVVGFGLSMLALEFDWAERLLERVLERLDEAKAASGGASRTQKLLGFGFLTVVAAALAFAGLRYQDFWKFW